MKPPKLPLVFGPCVAAALLLAASPVSAQDPAAPEKPVALHTADGKYVTASVSGGIDLSGKVVTNKQIFSVVDPNGGKLADGDDVKIKYSPGGADPSKNKSSFWHEEGNKINRVNKEPADGSAIFKLKQQANGFVLLQTASGKFAAAPTAEGGLGLAATPQEALVLTIEENPTPK